MRSFPANVVPLLTEQVLALQWVHAMLVHMSIHMSVHMSTRSCWHSTRLHNRRHALWYRCVPTCTMAELSKTEVAKATDMSIDMAANMCMRMS